MLQSRWSQRVGHDWATELNWTDLVISTCRVISCVVRRGCLLWPVYSVDKTLLAFALLYFVLQSQICLLTSYFCIPIPYDEMVIFFFLVLLLEGLVGLHRTSQFQLFGHQWLGHRLGLLWYWMVCLENKPRSFCHFWGCIQVLNFRLSCWLWRLFHFF